MNIDGIHAAAVSVERANANHGRVECDVVDETSGFQQVETVGNTFNKAIALLRHLKDGLAPPDEICIHCEKQRKQEVQSWQKKHKV